MTFSKAKEAFDNLDLETAEFNETQSLKAAELRIQTKQFGLSLGDRCCLALAIEKNLPPLLPIELGQILAFAKFK